MSKTRVSTFLGEDSFWFLFISPWKIPDAEKYSINKVCSSIPSDLYLVEKNKDDVWRVSENPVAYFSMKRGWRITGCGVWKRHQTISLFAHGLQAGTVLHLLKVSLNEATLCFGNLEEEAPGQM